MSPRVSVIIPTYNRAHLVGNAIESAFRQTMSDIEIIVVDDGSMDLTEELLLRRYAGRIQYIRQAQQGASVARNTGLFNAKGQWVAFLDSDDVWLPDKLHLQLEALEEYGSSCELCFTDVSFQGNENLKKTVFQTRREQHRPQMGVCSQPIRLLLNRKRMPPVWVQSAVLRTALACALGGFDPKMQCVGEDEDFLFRAALRTQFCFVNKPLVIVDRRPADERHRGTRWEELGFRLEHQQYRYERFLRMSAGESRKIRSAICRDLACVHSAWANYHLANRDRRKAQEAMRISLQYSAAPSRLVKLALISRFPRLAARLTVG